MEKLESRKLQRRKSRSGLTARAAVTLGTVSVLLLPGMLAAGSPERADARQGAGVQVPKEEGKLPSEKEAAKSREKLERSSAENTLTPAEVIAETSLLVYGTRVSLETARASVQEEGKIRLIAADAEITGDYTLRSVRKEKSWLDLLRIDLSLSPPQEARNAGVTRPITYVSAFNGASVWAAQNNQYITPRPEIEAAFRAQLTHDYETFLRYREDGSKLELIGPETVVGIETAVIDLTTPNGKKTRYWISSKTYRVLHLEYELKLNEDSPPVKYRVSYFYTPLRIVQNTLVPSRETMLQDGKLVQEITLDTITHSAKFEPDIFQHL